MAADRPEAEDKADSSGPSSSALYNEAFSSVTSSWKDSVIQRNQDSTSQKLPEIKIEESRKPDSNPLHPNTKPLDMGPDNATKPTTTQGSKALMAFFSAPEVEQHKDGKGSLSLDALNLVQTEAKSKGNEQLLSAAEFVKRHFDSLSRMSDDDAITENPVISKDDLKQLPIYERGMKDGYFLPYQDPRLGRKDYLEYVAKGASIGAGVQAVATAFGPAVYAVGTIVAMPAAFAGAAAGFIGGNVLGEHIEGTRNALLSYPLGMAGLFGGIAAGTTAAFYAWGPTLGGAMGYYMVAQHGHKRWDREERPAYEAMFNEMRKLRSASI